MSQQTSDTDYDAAKSGRAYRTIGEVSARLDLPSHVLRFWETRFNQLRPLKRSGNRRYYRPDDVALLQAIKRMLHEDGLTIKGVQKRFRDQGVKATVAAVLDEDGEGAALPASADAPTVFAAESAPAAAAEAGAADRAALRRVLDALRAMRAMLG